jgi:signal transduction histidine kinase
MLITVLLAIVFPIVLTELFENYLFNIPESMEWFVHCVVLLLTVLPVFYLIWYRPLLREMNERSLAEAEVSRLSRQVMEAGEEERRRLGRDLHDDIGQKLVALQLQVDLHYHELAGQYPGLAEQCRQIGGVIDGLADDLRQVIVALRPPLLDDLGLLPALEAHLADLRKVCPELEIQLLASGLGERLPMEVELVLFRACQEALSNVIRHAQARRALVRLTGSYPSVILVVEDDGVGVKEAAASAVDKHRHRFGLLGIRERVGSLGGSFKLHSAPGKGTRLRVEVPLSVEG